MSFSRKAFIYWTYSFYLYFPHILKMLRVSISYNTEMVKHLHFFLLFIYFLASLDKETMGDIIIALHPSSVCKKMFYSWAFPIKKCGIHPSISLPVCLKLFTFLTSSSESRHAQSLNLPQMFFYRGPEEVLYLFEAIINPRWLPLVSYRPRQFYFSKTTSYEDTRLSRNVPQGVLKKCYIF